MNTENTLQLTTPSDREITMTRVFNAPCAMVFAALTQPELLQRWFVGMPGWILTVCEIDLKVGGVYRYTWRRPDGSEMALRGVYREVNPPTRFANTQSFDTGCVDSSDDPLSTTVLSEHNGQTTLTCTTLYPSKEMRDAMLKTPMEKGASVAYDRLADLLDTVKK